MSYVKIALLVFAIFDVLHSAVSQSLEDCGRTAAISTRIVNAETIGNWPWMASVGHYVSGPLKKWNHMCGASLITKNVVLTAAHCALNKKWLVRLGDFNLESNKDDNHAINRNIEKIHIHPKYKVDQAYFDVALFEIKEVTLNDKVRLVCIPGVSSTDVNKYDSNSAKLTGWGTKFRNGSPSATLSRADLTIYEYSYCNETHSNKAGTLKAKIDKFVPELFPTHILCAGYPGGGVGSCQGDSGGPLVYYNTSRGQFIQVGSVSGGIGECGSEFPGIYVRLEHPLVLGFIKTVTKLPLVIVEENNQKIQKADPNFVRCKTVNAIPCILPFTYNDKSFTACTDEDNDDFWCPTNIDSSGSIVEWGACQSTCPRKTAEIKNCKTSNGLVIVVDIAEDCPETGITTTTRRPVLQTTPRRTFPTQRPIHLPSRPPSFSQPRPSNPPTSGNSFCHYTCRGTGSCIVRIVSDQSLGDGSVQGFCFAPSFGGTCSGIPEGCDPCLDLCSTRNDQEFRLPARLDFLKDTSGSAFTFESVGSQDGDHCLHQCKDNGGCSVELKTSALVGGAVKGSCFPPDFGGSCSGTPTGCDPCSQICGRNSGQVTIPVPIKRQFSGGK